MKKIVLKGCMAFLLYSLFILNSFAKPIEKVIDNGGSGQFKAEAISDPSLPGFVVYRPENMEAAVKVCGSLPLFVFANGACNDTSLPYERLLNDVASYGYLVVALGEMQDSINDRELHKSPNEDMIRAIDWAEKMNSDKNSKYYNKIDLEYVAFAGQSCGGAQVLANCADPRIKTCILFNSGMGDITMAEASRESLKNLHCPILYIIGGESDIAYANALKDYERIDNVPVAFANHLRAGHGGTFHEPYGGSFSRMTRDWLSWQFKDQRQNIDVFLRNRLADYPDFTMKAKNFPDSNEPFIVKEQHFKSRDGKDIWGQLYIPNSSEEKLPLVIMAHGYNSSHGEPKPFAETLAMRGVASYIFDFCGGSNYSRSEGKTTDMTIFTEKENLEDITAMIKKLDFVDSTRVALLGCSQGGLVASVTAAANPDQYKSLVLVYPALNIPNTAPFMLEKFDNDNNKPQDVWGMLLGRDYYEKINGLKPHEIAGNYKGDVFIVYGDNDMVIVEGLKGIDKIYEKSEIQVVPGGDHGFSNYSHHEQASKGIADFIVKTLSRPRERWSFHFDESYPDVHDPVMAYENGKYYMFTTGMGIGMMSSPDMKTWTPEKAPLDPVPEWPKQYVPSYQGHTWAPDIIKHKGKWYLYYSCSTFYKNISAIGVAVNKTLDPSSPDYKWEDLGLVIYSEPGKTDWNAIDPNVIIDKKGNPWMTFGSFWDGIQLVKLKKDMKTPAGQPVTVARRRHPELVAHLQETANTNAIEAPFITYYEGYYYLFASFDYCCKGMSSNYKTVVGRSKNVNGPYYDKDGKDMALTGGTLLVAENDKYSGVGHCSVYEFDGKWYFISHAYDKSKKGASKLFLHEIKWENGWPVIAD